MYTVDYYKQRARARPLSYPVLVSADRSPSQRRDPPDGAAMLAAFTEDIRRGRLVAVKRTLAAHPRVLNSRGVGRTTPLHAAADTGHHAVLRALLSYGADYNAADIAGELPLAHAARKVWHRRRRACTRTVRCCRPLLPPAGLPRFDRDRIRTNSNAPSPQGHAAAVRELLADAGRRAAAKSQAKDGSTPLHAAAAGGHAEVVQMLLDAGARADVRDRVSRAPLGASDSVCVHRHCCAGSAP